jgi:hypothetical protein
MFSKAEDFVFKKIDFKTSVNILDFMLSVYLDFQILISDLRVLFLNIRK